MLLGGTESYTARELVVAFYCVGTHAYRSGISGKQGLHNTTTTDSLCGKLGSGACVDEQVDGYMRDDGLNLA